MKAGVRVNLDAQSISTISKKDVRRGVLEYLQNQQQFARAHAKEGMAYASSWKEGMGSDPVTPAAGTNQSCGFTTPVLKHRTRPPLKDKQVNARRLNEVPASPRETLAPPKPIDRAANIKKRGSPHQRARVSKRNRFPQSEEEKRLEERREKKRIKRDIMQPERPKGQEDIDSPSKPNSKKAKQKLPAGLALMHGFTATNVGKNRLTVDPPFRPGVFNKGKASLQARIGKSRPRDSKANQAFSEEQFLKSNGRRRSNSVHTCSSAALSSEARSEPTDNLEHLRRSLQAEANLSDSAPTCEAKKSKSTKNQQKGGQKIQRARTRRSRQPSEEARSIVWDIEKDSGVLPSDSSSVKTPKFSTVLLDIAQKKWAADDKQDPPLSEGKSSNDSNDAVHTSDLNVNQRPSSVVSSVGPSKSASQVVPAPDKDPDEGVSKYFMLPRPPTTGPLDTSEHKSERSPPNLPEKGLVSLAEAETITSPVHSSDHIQQTSVFVGPEEQMGLILGQDTASYPQDTVDSDWLLSDSIPDDPSFNYKEDGWTPPAGPLELQCADDPDSSSDVIFSPLQGPGTYRDYLDSEEECYIYFGNDPVAMQQESYFLQNQLPLNDDTENTGIDDLSGDDALVLDTSPESLEPSELDCGVSERSLNEEFPLLFNEGRYLLRGHRNGATPTHLPQSDIRAIEVAVAQHLVSHWMPQRYYN